MDPDDESDAPAGSLARSERPSRNGPKSKAEDKDKPLTAYQQRKAARRAKGSGGGAEGDSELFRVAQMLREGKT